VYARAKLGHGKALLDPEVATLSRKRLAEELPKGILLKWKRSVVTRTIFTSSADRHGKGKKPDALIAGMDVVRFKTSRRSSPCHGIQVRIRMAAPEFLPEHIIRL
jgi:hypothetical protein